VVAPDAALTITAAGPDAAQPVSAETTPGLNRLVFNDPEPGAWTLTVANPGEAAIPYYLIMSTTAKPIYQTGTDLLISVGVVVAMIVAVGLAILAVERFRPRAGVSADDAALVDLATGARVRLPANPGAVTYIGSADDCKVRIDVPGVAQYHAAIRYSQERFFLQHQADEGQTLLNGQPVGAMRLVNGDQITVGATTFQFHQND
jgi:hypothetical protein